MTDENKKNEKLNAAPTLSNHLNRLQEIKALRAATVNESGWTTAQELLQEIHAGHIVADPNAKPKVTKMLEELRKTIKERFEDNEEQRDMILNSIPADVSVRAWLKKPEWEEAVWSKVRADGLFSQQNRAKVINSLMERALDKSDVAAKIWLTLSGDYSEKMEVNDKTIDTFREINSILLKKKAETEEE